MPQNLPRNNRNENRNYNFNYEMYDEEQIRSRFRLTKDGFPEMLDIKETNALMHFIQYKPYACTTVCFSTH